MQTRGRIRPRPSGRYFPRANVNAGWTAIASIRRQRRGEHRTMRAANFWSGLATSRARAATGVPAVCGRVSRALAFRQWFDRRPTCSGRSSRRRRRNLERIETTAAEDGDHAPLRQGGVPRVRAGSVCGLMACRWQEAMSERKVVHQFKPVRLSERFVARDTVCSA